MRSPRGFSLVEVLAALSVLALVALAAVATVVRGASETRENGLITQAARIISFMGDGLTSGDPRFFPTSGTAVTWDYGELETKFPALAAEAKFDPDLFKVTVTDKGAVSAVSDLDINARVWAIKVCFKSSLAGGDRCVTAKTIAVPPGGGS